jgi:hypothetical protein
MSSDRTLAEVWADQVATAKASGLTPPDRADPEADAILRGLLAEDPDAVFVLPAGVVVEVIDSSPDTPTTGAP